MEQSKIKKDLELDSKKNIYEEHIEPKIIERTNNDINSTLKKELK